MTAPAPDSVAGIAAGLARGDFSAEEVARRFLARIEALDSWFNSYVTVTAERAIEEARRADDARRRGSAGFLAGVPVAHKDLFCTRGVRTTCGSRMLANHVAAYDATVVERLRASGMVTLGKTNLDEFAMGSSTESSHFGPVCNPWDPERVAGGSSGGSAAAVAAGLAPVATATDTGGSIRQPAALCGLTGLKPTYGRVSRHGLVAFASSFDQGGLLARSAEDVALVLGEMAGFDERDSTSLDAPVDDYRAGLEAPIAGLRIGLVEEQFEDGVEAGVREAVGAAVRVLEGLGATIRPIRLEYADVGIPTYYMLAPAECSSNLSRFDGVRYGFRAPGVSSVEELYVESRTQGFGVEVKRRILAGTYALSKGYYDAYYGKAHGCAGSSRTTTGVRSRRWTSSRGRRPRPPRSGSGTVSTTPSRCISRTSSPSGVNLAGLCAVSVPAGFAGGLPVGLQLTGNHLEEARLLNVAHRFQQTTDWHLARPPLAEPAGGTPAGRTQGGGDPRRGRRLRARPDSRGAGPAMNPGSRSSGWRCTPASSPEASSSPGPRRATGRRRTPARAPSISGSPGCSRCSTARRCGWRSGSVSRSGPASRLAASSRARTTSTRICPRATRSASTRTRSRPEGRSPSSRPAAPAATSASSGPISRRTPAARCTRVSAAGPASTSTGRAPPCSRS